MSIRTVYVRHGRDTNGPEGDILCSIYKYLRTHTISVPMFIINCFFKLVLKSFFSSGEVDNNLKGKWYV